MAAHQSAIHPGEILKEEFLGPRGVSARRLARECDLPEELIARLIKGHGSITRAIAVGLAHGLGTTQAFWMELQRAYEISLLRGDLLAGASSPPTREVDESYFAELRASVPDKDRSSRED